MVIYAGNRNSGKVRINKNTNSNKTYGKQNEEKPTRTDKSNVKHNKSV